MPLYIDGLTSETTDKVIEEHLQECPACREKLQRMKGEGIRVTADEEKEIDFLKKTKKHNRKMILGSVLAVFLLVASVIGIRFYITGQDAGKGWLAAEVQADGNRFTVDAVSVSSLYSIRNIQFREESGVIFATVKAVMPSPLSSDRCHAEYTAKQPVSMVYVNDQVVWADGERIYPLTNDLFFRSHEYMGDMPANLAAANALNLSRAFGPYTNELVTDARPYRWKILAEEEVLPENRQKAESSMENYAYALIGVIGNLDEVEFIYTSGGQEYSKLVTEAEADDYFGEDIKSCGKNINALNRLIAKAGLNY